MNIKQQILNAARGLPNDRIPFTVYDWLIPEGVNADELSEAGIGIVKKASVYDIVYKDANFQSRYYVKDGVNYYETYIETPWGNLNGLSRQEPNYGSYSTAEYLIKEANDLKILGGIIQSSIICPNPDRYCLLEAQAPDNGIVFSSAERSPYQVLLNYYAGPEGLTYICYDFPDIVESVIDVMSEKEQEIAKIISDSPGDLVWLPDTVTAPLIGPEKFKKYNLASYKRYTEVLSISGKKLMVHMDGLLRSIADEIALSPVNIIEGFTPPPIGDLRVDEARKKWPSKSLWLNFASSAFLWNPDEIAGYTLDIVEQAGNTAGFLIGITDNFPVQHWNKTVSAILQVIDKNSNQSN